MSQQPPPPGPPEGWQRPTQLQGQGWGQPPSGPPTQPQWGQQPPAQPPKSKPPLYRRPWFIIIGAVVLVVIAASVFGEPPADEHAPQATAAPTTAAQALTTAESEPETTAKPETTARQSDLRRPVRDGQFEFVVRSVTCGKRRVGDAVLNQTAQGQFCMVAVRVENIGREPRTLDSSSQYLFDADGRRFETDDATLYIEEFGKAYLENINPGNSVNATIVFDVPRNFKAAKLELHDSPFSGGVEVNL